MHLFVVRHDCSDMIRLEAYIWRVTTMDHASHVVSRFTGFPSSAHQLLPQGSHPVGLAAIAGSLGLQRTTDDILQKAHLDERTCTICTCFLFETPGSHRFRVVDFGLLQDMGVFKGMSVSQDEQPSTIPKLF